MARAKMMTTREASKLRTVIGKLERLADSTRDMFVQDAYRKAVTVCSDLLTEAERREEPEPSANETEGELQPTEQAPLRDPPSSDAERDE